MNICLVRHGAVPTNYNNVVIGQQDVPLSEEGAEDIANLGWCMQSTGITFDGIFSSDLIRAKASAIILSDILGYSKTIAIDKRLRELNSGVFEGKPKILLEYFRQSHTNPQRAKPFHGESIVELTFRVNQFLGELLRNRGENFLLLTHYHPITAIWHKAKNINNIIRQQDMLQPNRGSMSKISYSYANKAFRIESVNIASN